MAKIFELTIMLLALCVGPALAGEVAVDPGDNGADIIEDTTEDTDSHSSEVAAAVEYFIDPVSIEVPTNGPVIPLAEAVTAAAQRVDIAA